jgi:hypothetical protein
MEGVCLHGFERFDTTSITELQSQKLRSCVPRHGQHANLPSGTVLFTTSSSYPAPPFPSTHST